MHIAQKLAATAVQLTLSGCNLHDTLHTVLQDKSISTYRYKLAKHLSYQTIRFYGELHFYLRQLSKHPIHDKYITSLLLVGLYQLRYRQSNEYTIVNQAIHAIPKQKLWAKGLVNAVLQQFIRNHTQLIEQSTQDETAHFSHQQWWIDKLKKEYPNDWKAILTINNSHPPMTLRINAQRTTVNDYMQLLSEHDISATHLGQSAIVLNTPQSPHALPGFDDGLCSIQDWGAQHASYLLDAHDGMRVLDACAAPGGKSCHLLEMHSLQLTALEKSPTRLAQLKNNLHRLHLNADCKLADATTLSWWDGVPFERILLDAPCSASGIVRRHVDIKWLRRPTDIDTFAQQQIKLLHTLWQTLMDGGKLLYSTCSIFHEENQMIIDKFLKTNLSAYQYPLCDCPPSLALGQSLPNEQHDGFFYALLGKSSA